MAKRERFSLPHCRRAGLTLLELLIILMIAGVLVMIAWPTLQPSSNQARIEFAKTQLRYLWNQENAFYTAHGTYASFPQLAADPELGKAFDQRFKLEQPIVDEVKFTGPSVGNPMLEITAVLPDGTGYRIDSRGAVSQYQAEPTTPQTPLPGP